MSNAADRASEMRTEEELLDLTMVRALVTLTTEWWGESGFKRK